jgi:hypothetical protein
LAEDLDLFVGGKEDEIGAAVLIGVMEGEGGGGTLETFGEGLDDGFEVGADECEFADEDSFGFAVAGPFVFAFAEDGEEWGTGADFAGGHDEGATWQYEGFGEGDATGGLDGGDADLFFVGTEEEEVRGTVLIPVHGDDVGDAAEGWEGAG